MTNNKQQLEATLIGPNYWAVRVANPSQAAYVPYVTEYVHAPSAAVAVWLVNCIFNVEV